MMMPNPGFDVVDVFAGQQSISKAWCKPQHHVGMFQHRILKVLGSFFWHIPMFPIDPKQLYFQKTCCLGLKAVTEQQAWTVTSIKLQWIFWNRQVSCFSPGLAIWLSRNGVGNPKGTPPPPRRLPVPFWNSCWDSKKQEICNWRVVLLTRFAF